MAEAEAQSSTETHFEVHVLKNGRWIIESTSREQELALSDAKSLVRQSEIRGVKVFKETTKLATGQSAAISIFTQLKQERKKSAVRFAPERRGVQRMPPAKPKPEPTPRLREPPKLEEKPTNLMNYFIIGTIVIMLGAAAVFFYDMIEPEAEAEALPTMIDLS